MKLVLRFLTHIRRVAVFSIGLVLVAAIGYQAVLQVRAQVAIQETALNQAALDSERRATALSYFFSEQKDFLKDLAESRALHAYFENQALVMSMDEEGYAMLSRTDPMDETALENMLGTPI